MKVYIIDDIFMEDTTYYTGEELEVYPVKISLLGLRKLKKEGISYTKDPEQVGKWIKEIEMKEDRDFGGIMIKKFKCAFKFNPNDYDWNKIKELKQKPGEEEQKKSNNSLKYLKVEDLPKTPSTERIINEEERDIENR